MLAGRTAIVTGGASGIGRAAAVLLAQHGAQVVVGDFAPLAENETRFGQLGIVQMKVDIRSEADVVEMVKRADSLGGKLDILVNNAGIGMVKPLPEVTEAEWDACIGTNLKGAFLATKHVIPHMQRHGGGAIVNVSSNAGLLPRAHDPVYSTSKGALVAFTRSAALCHSVDRIRINAVCPGPVEATRMMDDDLGSQADPAAAAQNYINASPLARAHNRMITPEEIAESILYLVSDAAAMVTGTMLAIDGGKSLGVPPRV